MNKNIYWWEIYFDGKQWNYKLAHDKDDADFKGSIEDVYMYVTELDKKDASQLYAQS